MRKIIILSMAFSLLMIMQCKSLHNKTLSADNVQILVDESGKQIGTIQQISASITRTEYDTNQNGIAEKIEVRENDVLKYVVYDKDESGKSDQWVNYVDGKPDTVDNFDKDGSRRSVTAFDTNGKIKYVDLFKQEKRVYYVDGKVDRIEDLKVEPKTKTTTETTIETTNDKD